MIDELLNLSDRDTKRRLYAAIAPLQGLHEVKIKAKRETRRVRANRYYFGLIVTPTMNEMNRHGNSMNRLEVHQWIKDRCLTKDIIDKDGVVIDQVADSSHDKDIPTFHAFVERAKQLVYDWWGVDAPDPDEYFAADAPTPASKGAA